MIRYSVKILFCGEYSETVDKKNMTYYNNVRRSEIIHESGA